MLSRVNAFTFSLVTCLFVLGGSLHAQQLEFSVDGGATFSTEFDANVGDTTTVEIFLNDSTEDLVAFGIDVQHDIGLGSVSGIATISPFSPDPANPITLRSDGGTVNAGSLSPSTGTSIPLASVDFVSTGAGVTNFTVSDIDTTPGITGDNFLTSSFTALDGVIFGAGNPTFAITSVAAIPEPSSGLLIVAACSSFLLRRKRGQ